MTIRAEWRGAQVKRATKTAEAEALFDAAEYVLETANRTVPFDEGTLARSGETDVDEGKLEASVSYETPYAVKMHEHPEYNFQGGRRGKWLELTLQEEQEAIRRIFESRLKRAF